MARLIQPLINVGISLSAQETYRFIKHSSEFNHNAFLLFGYPKRAFNDLHLRDHLISMVCRRCGEVEWVHSRLPIFLEIWTD